MRQRTLLGRPVGIGLILIQKSLWTAVLLVFAVVLLALHTQHVTQPFQELFENELAEDPHDLLANLLIGLVPQLSAGAGLLLAGGAVLYALLEGIEVWGLLRDVLWVELLIVFETVALLPYEAWELSRHFSPFKVLSIIINALIVWYLVVRYLRKREARLVERLEGVVREHQPHPRERS